MTCPTCNQSDQITGVEVSELYDGVLFWRCERCRFRFHRFAEGHYLRGKAEPFVDPQPVTMIPTQNAPSASQEKP